MCGALLSTICLLDLAIHTVGHEAVGIVRVVVVKSAGSVRVPACSQRFATSSSFNYELLRVATKSGLYHELLYTVPLRFHHQSLMVYSIIG